MLPPLPSLGFQPKFYSGGVSRFHLPFLYDLVALQRPRQVVTLGFADEQVHLTFCQAEREQELYLSLPDDPSPAGRRTRRG